MAPEFDTGQQTVQAGWNVGLPTTDEAVASSYFSGRTTFVGTTFVNASFVNASFVNATTLVDRAGHPRLSVDALSHRAAEFGTGTLDERAVAHADSLRDRGIDAERAADVDPI